MKKIEPFPGTITMQTVPSGRNMAGITKKIMLDEAQTAWLRKWFPEIENSCIMQASGLSHSTLHRFAREMGLQKSEKGLQGIKRRQAAQVKKVCKRNGYYASLKGKQPSDACKRATAQMWQEIREGKREHPARIMARENPKKYRQWMQRKSQSRKEAHRKEILRVTYGLDRKTKLHIVMCKYTKSQTSHRYNALRRGYILMTDCSEQGGERYNIYYDKDTERAEIFERNLIADGFHIKEWKE